MNDWLIGAACVVILFVVMIAGFAMGETYTGDQCDLGGKFKASGKVYVCHVEQKP